MVRSGCSIHCGPFAMSEPWLYIHVIIKLISMNKKEIRNAITREVCAFVTNLGYIISDDGMGGYLTFMKPEAKTHDDSIEWHRSYQEAVTFNWASDDTKFDAALIDKHMKPIIEHYNAQYVDKRKRVVA